MGLSHDCKSKTDEEVNITEEIRAPSEIAEDSDEELDFALATYLESELSEFTREAKNCAALDTCCTSSVAGKQWLDIFINSLSQDMKRKVV